VLGEAGACTFCRCCVGSGINAEQHLPRLNVAAFLEHPLLEDACGPGAHLGHARCLHAARQLGDQAYIARGGGDHAHFDGRGFGATRTGACPSALPQADTSSTAALMAASESTRRVVAARSCGVPDASCSWGMEVLWMCVRKGREPLGQAGLRALRAKSRQFDRKLYIQT